MRRGRRQLEHPAFRLGAGLDGELCQAQGLAVGVQSSGAFGGLHEGDLLASAVGSRSPKAAAARSALMYCEAAIPAMVSSSRLSK